MKCKYLVVWVSICLIAANAPQGLCKWPQRGDGVSGNTGEKVETGAGEQDKRAEPQRDKSASPASVAKDRKAEQIKWKLRTLGIASRVTIVLDNGNERYGSLERIGEDSFELAEVDLKQVFTVSYSDVKKVREGYGNPNQFNGKRWNPIWAKISLVAVIVMFAVVIPLSVPRT